MMETTILANRGVEGLAAVSSRS